MGTRTQERRDGASEASSSSSKQEEEATLPVRDAGESGGSLGPQRPSTALSACARAPAQVLFS
jgi:hypothetical protein